MERRRSEEKKDFSAAEYENYQSQQNKKGPALNKK